MANSQHFETGNAKNNPKRFANLDAHDLYDLLEAAHSKRTKYNTNFAVTVYMQRLVHLNFKFKLTPLVVY